MQGLQQARSSHNRSRRATADGSADLPPSGPPPVLVTGPDGTLLALGVRETAAKTPAEIQGSESPVHDKDATAESGTQAGNHIQVLGRLRSAELVKPCSPFQ